MSGYRSYLAPQPLLLGYDPVRDLPANHLARLVEQVVENAVHPAPRYHVEGQPPFDPRLCLKVLLYGYATGIRSSRRLEQNCDESLPYLFLTRGDTPSYRTLCTARKILHAQLEEVWEALFAVAAAAKMHRLGRLVLDSSRWRADAGREATVGRDEVAVVLAEFRRILAEAEQADLAEEAAGPRTETHLEAAVPAEQVRDVLRRVRQEQAARKAIEAAEPVPAPEAPLAENAPAPSDPPPTAPETGGTAASPQATLDLDVPPAEPASSATVPPVPTTVATPMPDPPAEPPVRKASPLPTGTPGTSPGGGLTAAFRRRVETVVAVLESALRDGRKHVNLTDPDAEFMPLGATKKLGLGHSFEAAVDQGLLVVGQRGAGCTDNSRLEPMLEAAAARLPDGVKGVDGDSGFYQGNVIGKLLAAGIDVCIPDSNTAGDLHRGQPIGTTRGRTGEWAFLTWDADENCFRCMGDNVLRAKQVREEHGQTWTVYRAVEPCTNCPFAAKCLQRKDAKHRTIRVGEYHAELEAARQRFGEPEHQARYRQRGPAIETVFAFIEHVLGYRRWSLRGDAGTDAEAKWIGLAYLTRKVAVRWDGAHGVPG